MQKTKLSFLTSMTWASLKSNSIRTAIPKEIADNLGWEIHDVLIWQANSEKITMKKWDGRQ